MHNLIIGALLGLAAGAIAGYLVGYSKGKKDGHKAAEAELGSAQDYINNRALNTPVTVQHEANVPTENGAVHVDHYTKDALHVERRPDSERVKYYACYGNTPPEVFTAPTDEDLEEDPDLATAFAQKEYMNELKTAGGDSPIWLIEPGQFGELGTESPEMVLKYWIGNGVLTTDEDEIIDNKQRYCGQFLSLFHSDASTEPAVFMRNSLVGRDISVEKIPAIFDGDPVHYQD